MASIQRSSSAAGSTVQDIPFIFYSTIFSSGIPYIADENIANNIYLRIPVPRNWDGVTDITIRTWWFSDQTGLADLEEEQGYLTSTNEDVATTTVAFTNNNLTWTTGNRYKVLNSTIAAANIAADRVMTIRWRRNTLDANTGVTSFNGARVRTGLNQS